MKIKEKIILLLIICIMSFALTGCKDLSGYKATVLDVKDYDETTLGEWINNCNQEDGYYEFIKLDPDRWEKYIYIRNYNSDLRYITYNTSLDINDSTIEIKTNSEDATDDGQVTTDILVYITAPMRDSWPNSSNVYVDGILWS